MDAFCRASEICPTLRLDYIGAGELLPTADLFVQHSVTDSAGNQEGLPVAVLEAMALSLPVVSTRHAGIPEAVRDGETGYLAAEGDTASMAERLTTLAQDPALRRRFGQAGWEAAREGFSWEKERAGLLSVMGLA